MTPGYIKLWRKTMETDFWTERREFSKFEAWIDMLMDANFQEREVVIGFESFKVKRGECLKSYEGWAKRWNWSRTKAYRYVTLLVRLRRVSVMKVTTKATHLSICNYSKYQDVRNASETQAERKRNASETQMCAPKEEEEGKKKNKSNTVSVLYTQEFEEFWKAYPRKVGKGSAFVEWKKIKGIADLLPIIINALQWQSKTESWTKENGKYIVHPERYLKRRRWEDEQNNIKPLQGDYEL